MDRFINDCKNLLKARKDKYLAILEKMKPEEMHWVWKWSRFSTVCHYQSRSRHIGDKQPHKQSTGTADLEHHSYRWSIIVKLKDVKLSQTEKIILSFKDCQT